MANLTSEEIIRSWESTSWHVHEPMVSWANMNAFREEMLRNIKNDLAHMWLTPKMFEDSIPMDIITFLSRKNGGHNHVHEPEVHDEKQLLQGHGHSESA